MVHEIVGFSHFRQHIAISCDRICRNQHHSYRIRFSLYFYLDHIEQIICLIVCNDLSIHDYDTSLTSYR